MGSGDGVGLEITPCSSPEGLLLEFLFQWVCGLGLTNSFLWFSMVLSVFVRVFCFFFLRGVGLVDLKGRLDSMFSLGPPSIKCSMFSIFSVVHMNTHTHTHTHTYPLQCYMNTAAGTLSVRGCSPLPSQRLASQRGPQGEPSGGGGTRKVHV